MIRYRSFQMVWALSALLLLSPTVNAQRKNDSQWGGPSKNNARILDLFKTVVAAPSESTVAVLIEGKQVALGTIVKADGYILTKDTELRGQSIMVRLKNGTELPATRIAGNDVWDLAMLKVDAKDLKPVEWTDSTVDPVGNWLATPGLSDKPLAIGIVSVAPRNLPGPKIALPKNNNERGFLGIQMEDSEGEGVKITGVTPKTPAEKAGLKIEDIILAINGKEITDRETLSATIGRCKPGDAVKIRFRRGETEDEVSATLERRPASFGTDRGDMQNSMGTDRSERRTGFPAALQHDTDLKASQCGGPLVDLEGRVIGINIARGGRTDTYAIPSESIKPLLSAMLAAKVTTVSNNVSALAEKLKQAELTMKVAEADRQAAEKKLEEAKANVQKLLVELKKEKEKSK